MHENSVIRIVGYVMGYFANGARPAHPWSLHLNFNKSHKSFELIPEHFTPDGQNISRRLLDQIQAVDPGWKVPGGEPVFIDARTKRQIKISESIDYSDIQGVLDRLHDEQPKEPTFYDIMDQVFGRER
jgi:hypothetical protein